MTKIKIGIEIDVDFQKYIDEIPEGTFAESAVIDDDWTFGERAIIDDNWKISAVYSFLNAAHSDRLMNHMSWMSKPDYAAAKHHLKIEDEIAKQIKENAKIEIVSSEKEDLKALFKAESGNIHYI